ncbi:UDP-glucose 4-epimerase GalE [uncultured Oscillibacter sp.]|uniref:UDP-glucose 4-epimerase GalE n=1 Tax=uncultured Oscillibacter sp. TaxID=876091 RepID=UPI0025D66F57|nr:UDP-glucose 4-epimerase GalE [uncultured Oscillibacter sp.]
MRILVCGGAGYIGSHTCVTLLEQGYDIAVVDDLSNSSAEALVRVARLTGREVPFLRADLCQRETAEEAFRRWPDIGAVIHFAGFKAVGESVQKPLKYYENNLVSTLNLLDAMAAAGVRNLVFSSSATVYGAPATVPVAEEAPLSATNPYGATKLMIERILTDLCRAEPEWNVALLRYFNPIGAHPSGLLGEDPRGIPNNLVPYIAKVALGELPVLHVFGGDYPTPDGTGVRDYIHVMDLAEGHAAALRRLENGCGLLVCNLGTGRGYSVLEVVRAYEKASGRPIPYVVEDRRPGDAAACWADPTRARQELGWSARRGLDEMCASSWNWQRKNPDGYRT